MTVSTVRKIWQKLITAHQSWRFGISGRNLSDSNHFSVEDGVSDNFLICLETGTRHVLLRRHIAETLGMTPAQYRRRWGLPDDYPMIARSYLRRRHAIKESSYEQHE
ncbi:MucR family transcriptional regulator [Heliomarina baculiformis]|uniref:MucR family transcriptional regulator n=1 Tax=Heliomarina baculiformis TaxID=2872036 RepID=UPI001EE1C413|nr:MucR family transcriptional regulator [Heliomarina baculiformis]